MTIGHERPWHHRTHRKYELNCRDFELLRYRAKEVCEICEPAGWPIRPGTLQIDHDHALGTWAVRGLLCNSCNSSIDHPNGVFAKWAAPRRYLENPFWKTLSTVQMTSIGPVYIGRLFD